jgi:hypothetical protein
MATGLAAIGGDSGGTVYYKGPTGVVVVGVLSGSYDGGGNNSAAYVIFTPMRAALGVTGSVLVRAPGLGVPAIGGAGLSTPYSQLVLSPDMTQDGRAELFGVDQDGRLVAYSTSSSGGIATSAALAGLGFTGYTVSAPGDWTGDGLPDLLAVTPSDGNMYSFQGLGGGSVASKVQIGNGWSGYRVVPVGDVTGDGNVDLLAIQNSTGDLYLYAGNGSGGFKYPYPKVGNGWSGFTLYAGGDLDGDGKADILSVTASGALYFYKGRGDGTFYASVLKGNGWTGYLLASGGDMNGDGKADIAGRQNSTGKLFFYRSTGSGTFAASVQIGTGF